MDILQFRVLKTATRGGHCTGALPAMLRSTLAYPNRNQCGNACFTLSEHDDAARQFHARCC